MRQCRAVRYMNAAGTGLLTALAAATLYVALKFVGAAVYLHFVAVPRARAQAEASGASSWDASQPQSFDLRAPLLVGFVVGIWWVLRRDRT